jgi:tripartite motif-containing protein 71
MAASLVLANAAYAQDMPTAAPNQLAELQQLSLPSDVSVGRDGQVFVVDGGNHEIAVFDSTGVRISSLGLMGSREGQFLSPLGIGVSRNGELYVADKGNGRIVMFNAKGEHQRTFSLTADGVDIVPIDVAVGPQGEELYVTTNTTHQVIVFSNRGQFLRSWGGEGDDDGKFRYPATIDVDDKGNVYVVDTLNARVQKFDGLGEHLQTIGKRGGKPGTFYRPKGVAVDATGKIYVSDSFLGVVQVFTPAGEFAYALGENGVAAVFDTPTGMETAGSRLFVVEMLPGRVALLEPRPPLPVVEEEPGE